MIHRYAKAHFTHGVNNATKDAWLVFHELGASGGAIFVSQREAPNRKQPQRIQVNMKATFPLTLALSSF